MTDYIKIPTSAEVWAVIRARHPEMVVFSTYSAEHGDIYGDPSKGKMITSYGFESGGFPVIEAQTTWDIETDRFPDRKNLKTEYWLCLPKRDTTNWE